MSTNRRISGGKQLGRNSLKFQGITQSEIAYLAGYTDGEGCITIVNDRTLVFGIETCYPKVVHRCYKLFGGHFSRLDRGRKKHRPIFRWRTFSKTAYMVIQTLLPFLREKKRQAELCLKFYNTKDVNKRVAINNQIKELKKIIYL